MKTNEISVYSSYKFVTIFNKYNALQYRRKCIHVSKARRWAFESGIYIFSLYL